MNVGHLSTSYYKNKNKQLLELKFQAQWLPTLGEDPEQG
jgi:hypothetical protein